MFNLVKNECGSLLVQGMVLAAVIAGAALVASKMTTEQKLAQKGAETRDNIEQLHERIYSILQNRDHCNSTMSTQGINTRVDANNFAAPFPTLTDIYIGLTPIFRLNTPYVNGSVVIQSMTLEWVGGSSAAPAKLKILYSRLESTNVTRRTQKGVGAKNIQKIIPIVIQRDPFSNLYRSCYSATEDDADATTSETGNENLSRDFCQGLNSTGAPGPSSYFIWDDVKNYCVPKSHLCPAGTIFSGINSNGITKCREIEEWLDLTKIIDATPRNCLNASKARFQVNNVTKKVEILCTP